NYVAVGPGRAFGSGFFGPRHQPLSVVDVARGVENLRSFVGTSQFDGRVGLLEEMEKAFYHEYRADAARAHHTTYQRAVTLMRSRQAKAFDLSLEPALAKAPYGSGRFGQGCLLARRLVEVGVPFV